MLKLVTLAGALTAMLRDLVLLKMGRYGDPDTVKEARRRFEEHCSGKSTIPADLRATVSLHFAITQLGLKI